MRTCRHGVLTQLLTLICLLAPIGAHAALYCVNSEAALRVAMSASQANGEDNEIQIEAGAYTLTQTLSYQSSQVHQLTIFGGYTPGCADLSHGFTVLSGGAAFAVMQLTSSSSSSLAGLHVERVTFVEGKANDGGAGLVALAVGGNIRLENNRFLYNVSADYGGGLYASTTGTLTVRNNLFYGNSAQDQGAAAALGCVNNVAYVIGNTVIGNTSHTANGAGGLFLGGNTAAHYWLSSNILWNNDSNNAVDVFAYTPTTFRYNDIGTTEQVVFGPQDVGNLSTDPMFAPCGTLLCVGFNLKRASPLVDAGDDNAPTGIGDEDVEYKVRKVGPHVDIGAFEQDDLFKNGFD